MQWTKDYPRWDQSTSRASLIPCPQGHVFREWTKRPWFGHSIFSVQESDNEHLVLPLFCPLRCSRGLDSGTYGGALKERRNGRAGKRSSKHLKMDNNKLSTKNPQLDSPEKIHTFWIKATCDSRFCVLDASEQKTNSLELTDGLPRHGPSDLDKVTKHERSVFRLSHIYLEQNARVPMKTRMDSSKHSEASCDRDAGRNPQFFGQSFRTRNVLSKTCQWTLQNAVMDSPFCSWTVRSAEKTHFWRKFQLSNRRLWRFQNAWLLFRPSFCWCSHLCLGRVCIYS